MEITAGLEAMTTLALVFELAGQPLVLAPLLGAGVLMVWLAVSLRT
jgi:hypothetical protein